MTTTNPRFEIVGILRNTFTNRVAALPAGERTVLWGGSGVAGGCSLVRVGLLVAYINASNRYEQTIWAAECTGHLAELVTALEAVPFRDR